MLSRRQFSIATVGLCAAAMTDRIALAKGTRSLESRIDRALDLATEFIARQQGADGAWRSDVYGPLKDGPSLTALIAATLRSAHISAADESLKRASNYLAQIVQQDGTLDRETPMTYPVYAAAGSILALGHSAQHTAARDAWLSHLKAHQLDERLGWRPIDLGYGGWSYAQSPPRPIDGKPPTPLAVPNLSATVFAVDALRAAGSNDVDIALARARAFVERCQNWCDESTGAISKFDDGGFYFLIEDPIRNKAGEVGADASGRIRYASYGSATADGLRALLTCGLSADHPRVQAGRRWLDRHFSAIEHPGGYATNKQHVRPAVYYYYAASVAQAFALLEEGGSHADNLSGWGCQLAEALLERQRIDGSWANAVVDTREDDPLVATPLAMRALAACRWFLK